MPTRADLVAEIRDLAGRGAAICEAVLTTYRDDREIKVPQRDYQAWYTKASAVLGLVAPDRLDEFRRLYRRSERQKLELDTYGISDRLIGISLRGHDTDSIVISNLMTQQAILESALDFAESHLSDLRGVLAANLFDRELDTAMELLESGYVRAAGAIAGVVLESHLRDLAQEKGSKSRKKRPTIADFNDGLKSVGAIQVPTWRRIQHLADVRNACVHPREEPPDTEDVKRLISDVDELVKTLA